MQDQFYVLSGEHPTIPSAECLAILDSLNIPYRAERYDQVLVLRAGEGSCKRIAERAAMVHRCCVLLTKCEANMDQIMARIRKIDFQRYISSESTFAVRVKRIKRYSPKLSSLSLEKKIGELIHTDTGAKVNLRDPETLFYGVLTESVFLFGRSVRESERKALNARKVKFRPFFVPSSMNPHLARAMVNLSRATPKGIFCDPFSGAGGILIEAGLIGCKIVGSDIDLRMVKGAEKNLKHFQVEDWNILLADAKNLPLNRADSIATDPPYGTSASTKGTSPEKLIADFLEELAKISGSIGHICIGAPLTIDLCEYAGEVGLRVIEKHLIRVHSSLTRQIIVLRK
ncbi:MAG: THUMP domain-containing protein [Candidatus Freyarchaeota archaeon]